MRADSPLLVELVGQPGSGKTTLARAAAAGSKIRTRASLGTAWKQLPYLDKAMLFGRALLDGACLFCIIRVAIRARLYRGDSIARLLRLLVKSYWIRAQGGELLLSEGCLQDLWSIYYSAGRREADPKQLAPLIRCLYRGVRADIIFLKVEPHHAYDRIRNRTDGRSRFDRHAEAELRRYLSETAQMPRMLADAARLAGLRVETLDASLPLNVSVGRLRAVMHELELLPSAET